MFPDMKSGTRLPTLLLVAFIAALPAACERKPGAGGKSGNAVSLAVARKGFVTKLIKNESGNEAPETPPPGVFDLIRYPSPAGELAAYVSPDPKDGKKHPIVIWLTGGFGNSISSLVWEKSLPVENDQSASAYRKAGIPMMYPSLRGGNDNPGFKEGLFGEVDDVLAAAEYAAALPWVDPSRIYLGGHSTGGTLALLACQASPRKDRFRAVFAFGPADEVALYGQENLPFSVRNRKEGELRAPIRYLDTIPCPTWVLEGEKGNTDSLAAMHARSRNPLVSFLTVVGSDHFALLHPANAVLAEKIKEDTAPTFNLTLTEDEIRAKTEEQPEAIFQPAGDLRSGASALGVVFYYDGEPAKVPADALRKAMDGPLKNVPVVADFENAPKPPFIVMMQEKAPLENYPVPNASYFKTSGRGMSEADVRAIQGTKQADIIVLVTPQDNAWENAKAFNEMVSRYSDETRAFIWDSATRECFHPLAWKKTRVEGWGKEVLPDLRSQITIHLYPREDGSGHLRAITLGMEKFGLPDVAIERLVSNDGNPSVHLLNLFCQTIATNPVLENPENLQLSIDALESTTIRDEYRSMVMDGGTGKATVAVMTGTPDEGDPENTQLTLDFRHGAGNTNDERRSSLLAGIWGSKSSVVDLGRDEELERLSREAKKELPSVRKKFQAGLPAASRLIVKAPFETDGGGTEWMWVEVLQWSDDDMLHGALQNTPRDIKQLKAGARVSVASKDLFDYVLYHADGSEEGNKTNKYIEEKSGGK